MPIESLAGSHILVLGGSTGMGYATTEYLLQSGAVVTAAARRAAKLESARDQLLKETGVPADRLRTVIADATDPAAVQTAVDAALDADGQLDGIYITAGDATYQSILDNTIESVQKEYVDNMYPLVNAIQFGAPKMMKNGGSIVATSSVASILSSLGIAAYGAAKAALEQYVRFASDELGRYQIRVNSVRPGLTKNGRDGQNLEDEAFIGHFRSITPLGDYGLPEDFAPMVSLLLSRETRWITGQNFSIDGGFSLRGHGGASSVVMTAKSQQP
jgi:NAD(P)-dependent dehydrogenase (short-subunit alcohol dehydrogenase family)